MKKFIVALAALLALGAVPASAQTAPVPTVTNVGPNDVFLDIVGGVATPQTQYAKAAQISGVQGYHDFGTISADPAYTVPNGVTNLFGYAGSTITAVTITTEPNPADGKRECYWAPVATTTLTWTANTGQSIDSHVLAAGVAKQSACITYEAASAKWVQSN